MANVPGILLVGGYSIQGGSSTDLIDGTVTSLGTNHLTDQRADKVMRVLPDNASTGAPTAGSLGWFPWFDGLSGTSRSISGTGTSTTVTVTGTPWTVNQFVPTATRTWFVSIPNTTGIGFQNRVPIVSNTNNTLTVASWPGGTPAAPQILFVSEGAWTDYHPIAGWLAGTEIFATVTKRGGSSWQTLGLGIGPDAGLLRELYENTYTTAPYFQFAKFATPLPTYSAFDNTTGTAKALWEVDLARYGTAWTALANGNTLTWDLLVLDLSQEDVLDWVSNPTHFLSYQSKLTETIAYFRSKLANSDLKVILVNHDEAINNVTAPFGTALANTVHRAVAAADPSVRCVSLQGLPLRSPGPTPTFYTPGSNRPCYAQAVYWNEYPRLVRQAYDLMLAGNPPAFDGAKPCYILIGDSIGVGPIDATYLGSLNSPTLTAGTRDSRQTIYNKQNVTVEVYDVGANSNTSGTTGTVAGPECSMMVDLMNLHPVTGFVLIKRCTNGSSLIANASPYSGGGTGGGRWSKSYASTEHYGQLTTDIQNAFNYVNRTLHKQVDLKGVFVILGTNDQAVSGGGALFAAELATFVNDLRTDFATRTSGDDLPIVWRQPQLAASTAIYDESVAVRESLAALAEEDANFIVVDVDDLERSSVDNLHETPDASIADGQRLVAALAQVAI